MADKAQKKKDEKPLTFEEKERRLAVSMLRLWAKKYPNDFKRIADEMKLKTT